jgi:Flp pilus assembly pilin Flp
MTHLGPATEDGPGTATPAVPPSENSLMEKLRAAVNAVGDRVARSRPVALLRARFGTTSTASGDQSGQGLAEYALILAGIAVVAIVSLMFLGSSISLLFEDIINEGFRYVDTIISG